MVPDHLRGWLGASPYHNKQLTDKEREAVVNVFKSNTGIFTENEAHVQANGVTLAGTKYFTISVSLSANEGHVYGKKGVSTPCDSFAWPD